MVLYDSVQPEVVRQQKRVVLSEVSALLALLRRNAKWSSGRSGQSGSLVGVARRLKQFYILHARVHAICDVD
jgi:hypothetical protein